MLMKNRLIYPVFLTVLIILPFLFGGCQSSEPDQEPDIQATMTSESDLEDPDGSRLAEREQMVENHIINRGVKDPAVLAAMKTVPRHEFVPDDFVSQAYRDHPLPIGYGQTISQPFIVALMTEALNLEKGDRVLEIGTGSGYQAAILAALDTQVYTIEIIPELAQAAEDRLINLGYANIEVLNADGYFGWEDQAPFDAVIVTAAPDHLPQLLIQQLSEGGRMIIPIGPVGAVQTLWLFESSEGELKAMNLGPVSFVPLTGEH
jgi:protein-L-isoaspartate(D-aspartate) O-methyltransferase